MSNDPSLPPPPPLPFIPRLLLKITASCCTASCCTASKRCCTFHPPSHPPNPPIPPPPLQTLRFLSSYPIPPPKFLLKAFSILHNLLRKTFKLSDGRSDSPIEYILNSDFTPAKPSIPLNRSKKLNELIDCLSSELEKNEIRNVRRRKRKRNCIEHKPFTVRFEGNFWERRKERTFFINGMRRKGWGIYF